MVSFSRGTHGSVLIPIPAILFAVSTGGTGGVVGVVSFGGVAPGITTFKSRLRVPSFSVVSACTVTCGVWFAAACIPARLFAGISKDFDEVSCFVGGATCLFWQENKMTAKSSGMNVCFM